MAEEQTKNVVKILRNIHLLTKECTTLWNVNLFFVVKDILTYNSPIRFYKKKFYIVNFQNSDNIESGKIKYIKGY